MGRSLVHDRPHPQRQARGTRYPDPVKAALDAEEAGADGITVHLRFTRTDEVWLPVSSDVGISVEGGLAPLEWKRFLDDSTLNMAQDRRLRASNSLEVHIPGWLVPSATDVDSQTDAIAPPVAYTLEGLEYHRAVALAEKGNRLTRTVVDGGLSGGRRTEIKLKYVPPPPACACRWKLRRFASRPGWAATATVTRTSPRP